MSDAAQRGGLWPWLDALTGAGRPTQDEASGEGAAAGVMATPSTDAGPLTLAAQLEALLAEESAALRIAAFDRLEGLATEKARLAEALADGPALSDDIALRLQAQLQRNAALLQATGAGLRAAAERIDSLTAPLQTYDGAGRRLPLSPAAPGGGRRA